MNTQSASARTNLRQRIWRLALIGLLLTSCGCGSNESASIHAGSDLSGPWKADLHFGELHPPVQKSGDTSSVEIVEVFSYDCPYCYAFEAEFVLFEARKPKSFHITRLPVVRSARERSLAKLFYSLQELQREDLHMAIYDAIHRSRSKLTGDNDEQTVDHLANFLEKRGVPRREFERAFKSSRVAENVDRAEKLGLSYKAAVTPTLVVNGQYSSDPQRAGGNSYLLALVYALADRELRQ